MAISTHEQSRPIRGPSAEQTALGSTARRRMLVVVNPHAASVSGRLRVLILSALRSRFEVDSVETEARGHATELCREAAHEGYDVVVAFGGDGTINEAANGLLGSDTPLCCLPGGSANVFARLIGVPGELVDATEHLLSLADDWHPRRIDLGFVNGRAFTFNSGVGIDASVVERVDARPQLKARFGPYYFLWQSVRTVLRRYMFRAPRLEVLAGGRSITGVTAVVQNGSPFTFFHDRPIEIADRVALDSGVLSAVVLRRATPLGISTISLRVLAPRAQVVRHRQVSPLRGLLELTIRSADGRSLPLQVDGDFLGQVQEARYSIQPAALAVIA